METGEAQNERVEPVVAEQPLSAHDEMAETFLARRPVSRSLPSPAWPPAWPGEAFAEYVNDNAQVESNSFLTTAEWLADLSP